MKKLSVRNEADEFKNKKVKQSVQLPMFLDGATWKGVGIGVETTLLTLFIFFL
jgi:hypothetical protein